MQEKHPSVAFHTLVTWGSNPQPRCVPDQEPNRQPCGARAAPNRLSPPPGSHDILTVSECPARLDSAAPHVACRTPLLQGLALGASVQTEAWHPVLTR